MEKILLIILAAGLLNSCGGGSSISSSDTGAGWGSYKCTAVSPSGATFTGWSAQSGDARSIALDKCQTKGGGSACRISQCVSE